MLPQPVELGKAAQGAVIFQTNSENQRLLVLEEVFVEQADRFVNIVALLLEEKRR